MKEIVILSKDNNRTAILQSLMERLFPECKTRVLAPGDRVLLKKKGERFGKYPCGR
jgi:hypothetical protein